MNWVLLPHSYPFSQHLLRHSSVKVPWGRPRWVRHELGWVDSFLRRFLSLTFYDSYENGNKDKKIMVTTVPFSFHIFQFLLSCALESTSFCFFLLIFFFTFFSFSSWDINHLIWPFILPYYLILEKMQVQNHFVTSNCL